MQRDNEIRVQPGAPVTAYRAIALLVVCGCAISLITFGMRSIFGLFTAPLSSAHGWNRDIFAFAIALQNLTWGLAQPFAGAVVDRFGAVRVLAAGGALYAAGTALMAWSATPLELSLSAGVLVGIGMGGASYVTVLGALGHLVPSTQRSWALGIATAAGSLGQFLFAPLGQVFIDSYGWQTAAVMLAMFVALVPVLSLGIRSRSVEEPGAATAEDGMRLVVAVRCALGHRSYRLLLIGFSVCGFQLAFITVHLPPYLADIGVSPRLAAWSIGLIGLANALGAYAAGVLGAIRSKPLLLTGIYLGRALAIGLFLTLPSSGLVVLTFAAVIGLLWLSTVPLTSGLVAAMFGTRYMATLFGLVFFTHQVGSFLGVWVGGFVYAYTSSYSMVWWLSVALGIASAYLHWPISEARAPRFGPATVWSTR